MLDLSRVILSNPTLLADLEVGDAARSWIQLARTGKFVSKRYGKFEISRDDLKQMLHNFKNVTPQAPTELPVDYDHLSMAPKQPGDGIAAGWMKNLELRDNGDSLYAEVEWTPDGAQRIRNKEYRFVSPSFVKDHQHKDGKKIGTTLLAAAVTNHPFLEQMEALTLYNFAAIGDLALADDEKAAETPAEEVPTTETGGSLPAAVEDENVITLPFAKYADFDDCVSQNGDKDDPKAFCGWLKNQVEGKADPTVDITALSAQWTATRPKPPAVPAVAAHKTLRVVSIARVDLTRPRLRRSRTFLLSEIGQRVMIAPGYARTQDEIGATLEIVEVVGEGDDAFVTLKDVNGVNHKWFRATELLPASAVAAQPVAPNLVPGLGPAGVPVPPGGVVHPAIAAQVAAAGGQPPPPGAGPAGPSTIDPATGLPAAPPGGAPAATGVPVLDPATGQPKLDENGQPVMQQVGPDGQPMVDEEGNPVLVEPAAAEGSAEEEATETPEEEAAEPDAEAAETPDEEAAEPAVAAAAAMVPVIDPATGQPVIDPLTGKPMMKPAVVAKKKKPVVAQLRHVVRALVVDALKGKKDTNMMFKLRTDENTEVEVTTEQLEAAGIRVVPDGSTVVPTTELADMKGKIVTLSSQVETLATAAETAAKSAVRHELVTELTRLSNGGLITRPQREYALKTWGETTDLAPFKEWAACFTVPVVSLNKSHGHGEDGAPTPAETATDQLIELANELVKDEGISLRDAMIKASKQLPQAAEAYRESFQLVR